MQKEEFKQGRRSFLKTIVELGGLALLPAPYAWGSDPFRFSDLIVFLPGITGSVLQKDNRDVWAITGQSIGNTLATLGRNVRALRLEEDPQDVDDLGDGVSATALFPDVHLVPGFWKIDGYSGVRAALG